MVFLVHPLCAQGGLIIRTVNLGNLPRVQLRIAPSPSVQPVPSLLASTITVTENGKQKLATHVCTDTSANRYIMFCLDRSGSIMGSMADIKLAAKQVVDSMRWQDYAGVVSFSSDVIVEHPLSLDHSSVKAALDGIATAGATAMYDAIDSCIALLSGKTGYKYILLLTDGEDNASIRKLDAVAARLRSEGIVILAIPFGDPGRAKDELQRLALESNGLYYSVLSRSKLFSSFADIADFLLAQFCDLVYETDCSDSLRAIHVEALYQGQSYTADTTVSSPIPPPRLIVRVDAPPELQPGMSRPITFSIDGPLADALLRFRLRIRYRGLFLPLTLTANTSGGVLDKQAVTVSRINPEEVEVSSGGVVPKAIGGTLFSLSLFVPPGMDSSRLYPIEIVEAEFAQGCDIPVTVINDTIEVCACRQEYPVQSPRLSVTSKDETLRISLLLDPWTDGGYGMEFVGSMSYDSTHLLFKGIETDGTLFAGGIAEAFNEAPGRIRLHVLLAAPSPALSLPVVTLVFTSHAAKDVENVLLDFSDLRLYAHCCPANREVDTSQVLVNGICSRVISRRHVATLLPNRPNPFSASTTLEYSLPEESNVTLTIYDLRGNRIATLVEGFASVGLHAVKFDASSLSAGMYCAVLQTPTQVVTRVMVAR